MIRFITLALALSSTIACNDSQQGSLEPTEVIAPAAALSDSEPTQDQAAKPGSIKDSLPKLSADELVELIDSIQPQKARNGELRFSDARLDTPAAGAILIARLSSGRDSEDVQNALIMALPRTQGTYAQAAVELLKSEKSERLRASLVDAMRLAPDADAALDGLSIGMKDSASSVRARAAFNIGRRADGAALLDVLLTGLNDSDVEVRANTARALGNLGASEAFDKVLPLLSSRDADVRLEALRGLGRMDSERASNLVELATLANDDDRRIQTAAAKVASKAY